MSVVWAEAGNAAKTSSDIRLIRRICRLVSALLQRHTITMSEPRDNLVLEHLRHIRGSVDDLRVDMKDVKIRLYFVETRLAGVEGQVVGSHAEYAHVSTRIDRVDARLARIESRLGLIEA